MLHLTPSFFCFPETNQWSSLLELQQLSTRIWSLVLGKFAQAHSTPRKLTSSPYTFPFNSIFRGPTKIHGFNLVFSSGSVFPTLKPALGAAGFL